jgi:putative membrane protein
VNHALASWAVNLAGLLVADLLIGGMRIDHWYVAVVAGAVLGLVNWLVKPLVTVLALPAIILTLGVALFFVNLLMLALTAWLVAGFTLGGFWPAVGATIVVWIVNAALTAFFGLDERWEERGPLSGNRR